MSAPIRRLIILLLMLSLPLSGMAGIEPPAEPCPMQALGMSMMAGMDHDCCQDQDKASSHHASKACKPGQECKTATTLQVSLATPALTFATPRPSDSYAQSLLSRAPPAHWRPPRI